MIRLRATRTIEHDRARYEAGAELVVPAAAAEALIACGAAEPVADGGAPDGVPVHAVGEEAGEGERRRPRARR